MPLSPDERRNLEEVSYNLEEAMKTLESPAFVPNPLSAPGTPARKLENKLIEVIDNINAQKYIVDGTLGRATSEDWDGRSRVKRGRRSTRRSTRRKSKE